MTYQPRNENLATGIISGCVVTMNADTTKYDISSGILAIEDWTNPLEPRLKRLSYTGVTGQTPPNPTTSSFTLIFLEESSTEGIAQLDEEEDGGAGTSSTTRRSKVALSALIHAAGDGVISNISTDKQIGYEMWQANLDMNAIRPAVNTGNVLSANGTNLNIDRASGNTSKPFFNSANNPQSPTSIINIADTSFNFIYQRQPGVTFLQFGNTVDPDNYDNAGTLTAVPNNNWTIQRVYFFGQTPSTAIMYGQNLYSTKSGAQLAIEAENFIVPSNTAAAVWIATLVVKSGTTDLSDTGANVIVNR